MVLGFRLERFERLKVYGDRGNLGAIHAHVPDKLGGWTTIITTTTTATTTITTTTATTTTTTV